MIGQAIRNAIAPVLFLLAASTIVALHCGVAGCKPAESPTTAHRRAVLVTLAHGVKAADQACASIVRAKKDAALGHACDEARDDAAEVLNAAEEILDGEDSARAGDIPCMVKQAVASASRIAGLIEKAGGKLPPATRDGLELAPMIAGACNG